MSKPGKILSLCAIALLAWLATMPYWAVIKEEAKTIYATWQAIRSEDEAAVETEEKSEPAEETTRERSIAKPKPTEELAKLASEEASSESLDPFIREARERAQADPEAAMQWLQEQSTGTERLRGMLEVVALWAAKDSESALFWLESNAQGLARLETLNSGVELWAERDPRAAAGWIDGMANDGSKIAAAKSLASTWVRTSPTAAAEWLDTLPNGPLREEAASALALSWMEADPASAAQWAHEEYAYTGNKQLIIDTIQSYAKIDPEAAETFARKAPNTNLASSQLFDPTLVSEFVKARAGADPIGTAEWLQSLEKSDASYSPDYATSLMQVWTETDSIAASAWLSQQPLGAERDAAIVGFAGSIQRFEPEAAVTWAETISDPNQRTELLTQSIRTWGREKPDAALEWVINSDLAPAEKEQLAREIGFD